MTAANHLNSHARTVFFMPFEASVTVHIMPSLLQLTWVRRRSEPTV